MVPASMTMVALLIFTGFIVPVDYMLPWCRWINYVNHLAYGYEALMVNEFHSRHFECSVYIPDYANATTKSGACDAVGAVVGSLYVSGDDHILAAYGSQHIHKWRNVAIIIAMVFFKYLVYFITSEFVTAKKSKGEILIFR
jgi:ATP-binding cassette subfamily G (WHITE) protein 2 (PDR)